MKAIKCNTCGGDVEFKNEESLATCKFCGNKMYLENPYKAKETITRVIIEDKSDRQPKQTYTEPAPTPAPTITPVKKRGCLATVGWIFLWLLFWPIMIFVVIFRKKDWSMTKKVVIAALVFVMLMSLSQCSSAEEVAGVLDVLAVNYV